MTKTAGLSFRVKLLLNLQRVIFPQPSLKLSQKSGSGILVSVLIFLVKWSWLIFWYCPERYIIIRILSEFAGFGIILDDWSLKTNLSFITKRIVSFQYTDTIYSFVIVSANTNVMIRRKILLSIGVRLHQSKLISGWRAFSKAF